MHKITHRDFDWDYIELYIDQVGKTDISTILSLSIHEHRIYLYLVLWFSSSELCSLSSIDLIYILFNL